MSDLGSSRNPSAASPPRGDGAGSPPAKEQAKEVASTAASQTSEVASSASQGAKEVASEAGRQVTDLAQQASGQAKEVLGQATDQLRQQATEQTSRAAEGLKSLSQQVQALTEGRPEDAGAVGDYARQAGERLQQAASRLEDGGVDGLLDDVQGFARRRPGLFLLGAGGLGFAVGRLLRGAQAASSGSSQPEATPQRIGRLGRADGPFADVASPDAVPATTLRDDEAVGVVGASPTGVRP